MKRNRWRRTLSTRLARLASRALPESRQDWARAIESETAAVHDDGDALRWAAGGVRAAYVERLGAVRIMELGTVRFFVGATIAAKAISDFFAPALTFAYRKGALDVANLLGSQTAGDDYRRFIPLMDAVPIWIHGLWVFAGVLYLAAIASIARRSRSASPLVSAALALDIVAELASRPIEAATGVVVRIPHSKVELVFPFAVPFMLALLLWHHQRKVRAVTEESI